MENNDLPMDDARNDPTCLPRKASNNLKIPIISKLFSRRPHRVLKWSGTLGIIGLVSALFVLFQAGNLPVAFGSNFSNSTAITINDNAAATPYPSAINV